LFVISKLRNGPAVGRLPRRLEQFNGIAIGIFHLDLSAAWPDLHVVAEAEPCFLHPLDALREIRDTENDAVPPAGLLALAVRHLARTGRPGAAEQKVQLSERDVREGRELLTLECETELVDVERDSATHVADLITNPVEAFYEAVRRSRHAGLLAGWS
jgi:hypothetical protein